MTLVLRHNHLLRVNEFQEFSGLAPSHDEGDRLENRQLQQGKLSWKNVSTSRYLFRDEFQSMEYIELQFLQMLLDCQAYLEPQK